MNIIESLAKRFGFVRPQQKSAWPQGRPMQEKRDFSASLEDRLTSDWVSGNTTADSEIRSGLKTARNRARDLVRNNDYVRRYNKLVVNNVLGATGIGLQMKVREYVRKGSRFVSQYDEIANTLIEDAWYKWNRAQYCSRDSRASWCAIQRLVLM